MHDKMDTEVNRIYKNHGTVRFLVGKWKTLFLVHENFMYKRTNGNFPKTPWICAAVGCSITVYTNNGNFKEETENSSHYHAPATDQIVDIDDAFIEIHESAPMAQNNIISNDQIQKFHDYMVDTWIHDTDAKFNRKLWNQYQNEGPRTTNNAEGWNHKLNQSANSRMAFYQFVHLLQKMQVDLEATKFDLISESPSKRESKYTLADEKINCAKLNYASGNVPVLSYLDSISFAIKLD